jgi:hypothetical protein
MTKCAYCFLFFAIASAYAQQKPATALSPHAKRVFDVMYSQFDLTQKQDVYELRLIKAVREALAAATAESDRLAAVLPQFEFPDSVVKSVREYCQRRGPVMLPYLKIYRDVPYPLPPKYQSSMRTTPSRRRLEYDRIIGDIQSLSRSTGIGPEVAAFVIPILDALNGKGDLMDAVTRVFESQTVAADEALAVLLEYTSDGHYAEELPFEIVLRGKRMLKWLQKYQNRPTLTLAANYPKDLRVDLDKRIEDFEWLIEVIQLGEVFDH